MFNDAIAECQLEVTLGESGEAWGNLGHAYAVAGDTSGARRVLERLTQLPPTADVSPFDFAVVYVGLGRDEAALNALEEACDHHSERVVSIKSEPRFDRLRSIPRFQALLRRMNLDNMAVMARDSVRSRQEK